MITRETKKYDFYTDNIFQYARNGVIQASTFIGAVLNKDNNFDIKEWNIDKFWQLLPVFSLDDRSILQYFKSFVVKSALCEMMMEFEHTLIELYDALLLAINTANNKHYNINTHLAAIKQFKDCDNFENKLEKINKIIKSKKQNKHLWQNLKYIRNCITHNNSIVDKGDIKLAIKRIALAMKDNDTGKIYYSSKDNSDFYLGDLPGHAATLKIDFITEDKIFKNGERIEFSPGEIYYLLFTLYESIDNLEILCVNFFINNHVEFGKNEKNGMIKSQEELDKLYSNKRELHVYLMPKGTMGAKG